MQTPLIPTGWLPLDRTISHRPSSNYDARPTAEVSLLVIHHISLPPHQFGSDDIIDFFTNQLDSSRHAFYAQIAHLKVSAHVLIRRNGAIVQFVDFNQRAWHAGQSDFQGRANCNDFSIGIELEGDELTPYRYAQYKVLGRLTRLLQSAYPDIGRRIVGHEAIAPQRKTDPGPTFDWQRYLQTL